MITSQHLGEPISAIVSSAIAATTATVKALNKQKELNIYPECGKRPFFTGRRRNEWDQCVNNLQNINKNAGIPENVQNWFSQQNAQGTVQSFFEKNKTTIYIGGAALVGLIIYQQIKSK